MIKTILGVILLLVPFLLIYRFKDKKLGFAYILSFLIAFHLVVAVITQIFGIFNYVIIFIINIIVCFLVLTKINFKSFFEELKKIKLDWVLIFILVIIFIELFFVHYNYTGKITTAVENYKEVKNMKYPYPYFSDEWSAVAFIKYSIREGKLPLANILWYNSPFPNLELPFHSFVSEIILLLGLNPLTQYNILTIFSGILVCLLVYFILRINNIGKLASSITSLSVPYIVNGANLPGIWTLVPLILGIISMLLAILFISANKHKMVLFAGFLTLIFYPPLFVLYSVAFVLYFVFVDISRKPKIKYILLYFLIVLFAAFFVAIFTYLTINLSLESFISSYLKDKIFYSTFTKNAIPNFPIYKIVPIPILLFSIFSIFKFFRKKIWLIMPIFIGLLYWLLYSFILWRFIIEYERVVVSTSILLAISAGFGLSYIIDYLRKFNFAEKYKILQILQVLVLILFFIFAFFYTQRDNWQDLKLYALDGETFYNPAAPANLYLQQDDLKLFKGIEKKRFLSIPWKGTVIGTATDNYPLETKPATLTNSIASFSEFMSADCSGKEKIAKEKEINYIYSYEFNCTGFELIGISKEDLHLYEVKK